MPMSLSILMSLLVPVAQSGATRPPPGRSVPTIAPADPGRVTEGPSSVRIDVGLAQPVLPANQKTVARLRISLTGQEAPRASQRPEANVCLAIDRSGSMAGDKIENARTGAIGALKRLRDSDIVSVVAYDDVVRVIVPATRAAARGAVERGIAQLTPGGDTALFAGVVKCAAEVRKFASRNRVNRIVLLSDGMANVGPSSPSELGILGAQLAAEGISVATVGLGLDYNEDLMAELALRSDGNHTFVQYPTDLARFLDGEFDAVTAVVARDVDVMVRCAPGARPLRVLGRPADIVGREVTTSLGKIYGKREHFFVVELELEPGTAGAARDLATVEIKYRDMLANRDTRRSVPMTGRFALHAEEVDAHTNARIMSEVSLLEADAETERAIGLRDKGDFAAAQKVLQQNAAALQSTANMYKDVRVQPRLQKAKEQASSLSAKPADWNVQRKAYKRDISDLPLNGL